MPMSEGTTHVVDAPLAPPSANSGLLEVFRRRYLLRLLVRREISARYQGSFLGLFWSYLNPAFRLAMYYFVVALVLGKSIENFAIHLFAGLVMVQFFTESFGAGSRSIMRNKALVRKMAIPREMFPAASILVSAYHIIPAMILLSAICVAKGWSPDPVGIAAGLLGFTIVAVLGTAMALLFSASNVFFRDFANVVQTLTQFTTFSVPMMYPYSFVDERFGKFADIYLLNPVAEAVLLFQRCFWTGTTSDPEATVAEHMPDNLFTLAFLHVGAALVFLVIAQMVFTKLENKIPERL
jgi:ABC-2 type transport system permease protein